MADVDEEIQWIKDRLAEHEQKLINLEQEIQSLRSQL
jgi:hypothetical protein